MEKVTVAKKTENERKILPISVRSTLQIGNAVRRLRKSKNFSQAKLAQKAGLTQATVSRIEKGYQKAEIHTLLLIFLALDADLVITERQKINLVNPLEGLF